MSRSSASGSLQPAHRNAATPGRWRAKSPVRAVSYLRAPDDTRFRAFKLDVLHVAGNRLAEITTFDVRYLDAFGLPEVLP
jgi:hypothetical protein